MFKDIKTLLPKAVKRVGISRQLDSVRLIKTFEKSAVDLLGEELASKIKVLYIKEKNISLISFSPEVARKIRKEESSLVGLANKMAGGDYLERIRIVG